VGWQRVGETGEPEVGGLGAGAIEQGAPTHPHQTGLLHPAGPPHLCAGLATSSASCWWDATASRVPHYWLPCAGGPRGGCGEARVRDEECKLLRQVAQLWGRLVVHVFDRGYESLVWLGALYAFAVRFVLRWRHDYRLVDAQGQTRLAWKMVQGKRAWGKGRPLWDAKRCKHVQASVLACPVTHPDFPQWSLWLVVGRRQGGTPWYLLTNEPVETEEQAWAVVLAYARRWQIELSWRNCKSELGMQSPRVWGWEERLKPLSDRDAGLCLPVASSLTLLWATTLVALALCGSLVLVGMLDSPMSLSRACA